MYIHIYKETIESETVVVVSGIYEIRRGRQRGNESVQIIGVRRRRRSRGRATDVEVDMHHLHTITKGREEG